MQHPRGWVVRRLLVALIVVLAILAGGTGIAGTYLLLDRFLGPLPALAMTVVSAALGAVLIFPIWFDLRQWAGVPRLETCRQELLAAMQALPSTTDSVTLAECLVEVCRRLLPGRPIAVLLPEPRMERFVPAARSKGSDRPLQTLELPRRSPLARALERDHRHQTVEVGDGGSRGRRRGRPQVETLIPMHVHGDMVGVLAIGPARDGRRLRADEVKIAQEICAHAGGSFENAELYGSLRDAFTELETAQRELLALQRATTAAQSSLNLQDVLRKVCSGVIEGLDFQEAVLFLVDPITRVITPSSAAGRLMAPRIRSRATTEEAKPLRLDLNRTITRNLLDHEIVISPNPGSSILPYLLTPDEASSREFFQNRTVVSVPLVANGDVVGGMALLTEHRQIAERELDSLRGFAAQAASAIVNARLYEDLREAYTDLRAAQDELVRTERLRSAGEVASGVAHDFNNILLAILTQAQIAQRQTSEPLLLHALTVIQQAAMDGSEVVKRIQNLARTAAPQVREPLDLNVILRQSVDIAQPIWTAAAESRGTTITAEVELGEASRIVGSPSELREVFVNLIVNAVQAMPEGGTLSLRSFVKDGHWWGEVRDTGVGMTADVKRRVFEPFFTTKGAAGSGLGLSIVASIVQRHAGLIEVNSEPGRGTTVAVGFPLSLGGELRREPVASRRVKVHDALSILVVDDDDRVRESLHSVLSHLGHNVHASAEAGEALRTFLDNDFNVVITDLSLTGSSGLEIAKAVKRMRRGVDVILITGWGTQVDGTNPAYDAVDQILNKPFTFEQVAEALEHARGRMEAARQSTSA